MELSCILSSCKSKGNCTPAIFVVRKTINRLYLYDMINIKKKPVRRLSQNDCTVKKRFSFIDNNINKYKIQEEN